MEAVAICFKLGIEPVAIVSSLVLEAVAMHFKLGIEPVAIRSKLGIEHVAICFKLTIGVCCDMFQAWYWRLLRYVQSLVLEPVAIRFKLAWY